MHIHVGIQNLQPRVRFHEGLDVVELGHMMHGFYRESTFRNLAQAALPGSRFVVAVPQAVTDPEWERPFRGIEPEKLRGFAPSEHQERVVAQVCRAAGLLRSQTVLIRTPATFTPARRHLDRLRDFVHLPAWKNLRRVWQAEGVWDAAHVVHTAREMGIVPVWDPLMASLRETGDFAYFRVRGPMPAKLLSELQFQRLMEACMGFRRSFVVFCTLHARADALNFLKFLQNEA